MRTLMPVKGSRSAHGLLYLAAERDTGASIKTGAAARRTRCRALRWGRPPGTGAPHSWTVFRGSATLTRQQHRLLSVAVFPGS